MLQYFWSCCATVVHAAKLADGGAKGCAEPEHYAEAVESAAYGYALEIEAWGRFCKKHSMEPDALLEGRLGWEYVEASEALLLNTAPTVEQVTGRLRKWRYPSMMAHG